MWLVIIQMRGVIAVSVTNPAKRPKLALILALDRDREWAVFPNPPFSPLPEAPDHPAPIDLIRIAAQSPGKGGSSVFVGHPRKGYRPGPTLPTGFVGAT